MKSIKLILLFVLLIPIFSCSKEEEEANPNTNTNDNTDTGEIVIQYYDGQIVTGFGTLPYRVYYQKDMTTQTYAIHVSRGGNGNGEDRGELYPYVEKCVEDGYVVIQIDHRFAGNDINLIGKYRGEEINFIAGKIADGSLNLGSFQGTIDGSKQGFIGHSAGCMEGLEAAGLDMTHGNYFVPEIKAVYGMSPSGNNPDQYGITSNGFAAINETAIFIILGEEEKDTNGPGTFMANDWRLQAYEGMDEDGIRYQSFVKGTNTTHSDIPITNPEIVKYNLDNLQAFFDTYIKGMDRSAEIGNLSLPNNNVIEISNKGL